MELKYAIFFAGLFVGVPLGTAIAVVSKRVRDACFFLLVFGTAESYLFDINFVSREFYRGSTRGIEFSFLDLLGMIILMAVLLVPSNGRRPWFWPASLTGLVLYFFYACFSVAISDPKLFGLFELSKIGRGILMFVATAFFVRGEREIKLLVAALGTALVYEGGIALQHRYLFGIYRVSATLGHPNSLSMYGCIAGPVVLACAMSNLSSTLRWFYLLSAGFAAICVLFTISRMGVAAFGLVMAGTAVVCSSLRHINLKKIAIAFLAIFVVACGVLKSWDSLMSRYSQASLAEEYVDSEMGRGMYLRLMFLVIKDHFLGVGLNNWSYIVSSQYHPKLGLRSASYNGTGKSMVEGLSPIEYTFYLAPPAHNLYALTLGELGIPGFLIFLSIWTRWFHIGAKFLRKRSDEILSRFGIGVLFGLSGCFLQSLTEWEYRQTPLFMLVHILVGALTSVYYTRRYENRKTVRS